MKIATIFLMSLLSLMNFSDTALSVRGIRNSSLVTNNLFFIQRSATLKKRCYSSYNEIVENGLRYPVKIKNHEDKPFKLLERIDYYKVPGVSIAIIDEGRIAWAKGFGIADIKTHRLVDENTVFQAASLSKMITAVGAMLLVQQGKLNLDTDVNLYLKRWKVPKRKPYENEPLTLRQILSHTGGITVPSVLGYNKDENIPRLFEFLKGTKPISKNDAVEMASKPGEFHYSGGGTTIIEILVKDITGMSFRDYIQKSVFDPLKMTRSYFVRPLPKEEMNFAACHDINGEPIPGKYYNYPSFSAAGLWTTPLDLAKVGLSIQKSFIGKGLLNPELSKEMITPTINAFGEFAGLGCFIRKDKKIFGHAGSNIGMWCSADFTIHGQKGCVIMTNSDSGEELEAELRYSVYDAYNWPLLPNLEKTLSKIKSSILHSYAGEYWTIADKGTPQEKKIKSCIIKVEDDHLTLQWFRYQDAVCTTYIPSLSYPAYPESARSFFTRHGVEMIFEGENQFKIGNVIHFKK